VLDLPTTIAGLSGRLSNLTADEATATAHADDPIKIAGRNCLGEDVPAILAGQLDSLPPFVRETTRVPLGVYRGLQFGIVLHSQFPTDVYLEGAVTRQWGLSREHQGPRAVLNALERVVGAYGSESVRVRQDLAIAESQLRDYQARLGKPFLHDVSELAERIKALKAARNIEATPQRVRQKQSSAEEPVTARIRRRTKVVHADGPLLHPDMAALGPAASPPPESEQNSSTDREMTFRERIATERRRPDPDPSLS
jgi:hypothetical protein